MHSENHFLTGLDVGLQFPRACNTLLLTDVNSPISSSLEDHIGALYKADRFFLEDRGSAREIRMVPLLLSR